MNTNTLITEFKTKWLEKAKGYIQNPIRIQQLIPEIKSYVSKVGLKEVKDKILLAIDYLKDITSHQYTDYEPKTLAFLIAAMIYLVSPLDVIPDIIPVIGLTDDISVILFVFKEFEKELDRYKKWKLENNVLNG